jgi:hypothetical protein
MTHTSPPDPAEDPPDDAPASPWSAFEAAYRGVVSLDRLLRYRKDRDRAAWAPLIGRYMYNVEVARALVPVLHWAEIALRNRLDRVIGAAYPVRGAGSFVDVPSWLDANPPVLLANERARVEQAKRALLRRLPPSGHGARRRPATGGMLVAELSLGFWTHLLDGAYENWRIPNRLWPALLEPVFPHCPPAELTRRTVHGRFQEIKHIRNRAFHHERISHQVNVAMYDRFVETVSWIDPLVAGALVERERAAFVALLRAGPGPFVEWVGRRAA